MTLEVYTLICSMALALAITVPLLINLLIAQHKRKPLKATPEQINEEINLYGVAYTYSDVLLDSDKVVRYFHQSKTNERPRTIYIKKNRANELWYISTVKTALCGPTQDDPTCYYRDGKWVTGRPAYYTDPDIAVSIAEDMGYENTRAHDFNCYTMDLKQRVTHK